MTRPMPAVPETTDVHTALYERSSHGDKFSNKLSPIKRDVAHKTKITNALAIKMINSESVRPGATRLLSMGVSTMRTCVDAAEPTGISRRPSTGTRGNHR